jgi:hypothetical protein
MAEPERDFPQIFCGLQDRHRAGVCLETCGDTRFDAREEQRFSAMRTYFRRMYSNPANVIHPLRALINSSGTRTSPLTESQARTAEAVSVHSGTNRLSMREFPGSRDGQVPMSDPTQKVLGYPKVLARRHPLITRSSVRERAMIRTVGPSAVFLPLASRHAYWPQISKNRQADSFLPV